MTFNVIGTGSRGNAVVIDDVILVDCGVSWKKLATYTHNLKVVLLTHWHSDHFNERTVKRLAFERPGLRWFCCEWMSGYAIKAGVRPAMIHLLHERVFTAKDDIIVQPVFLLHDVPNCGFKIWHGTGNAQESLFYATDTGTLDGIDAKGFDYYLIEANHTEAEIEQRYKEKMEHGEYAYEVKAAANHLSREQALNWLAQNAGPRSEYMFLHQHQ